jgi:hypothetical protein
MLPPDFLEGGLQVRVGQLYHLQPQVGVISLEHSGRVWLRELREKTQGVRDSANKARERQRDSAGRCTPLR